MSFATMATLALGGAALGAIANPEDREKGALMGLGAGLLAPVAAPGLLAAPVAAAPVAAPTALAAAAPTVASAAPAVASAAPVVAGAGTAGAGAGTAGAAASTASAKSAMALDAAARSQALAANAAKVPIAQIQSVMPGAAIGPGGIGHTGTLASKASALGEFGLNKAGAGLSKVGDLVTSEGAKDLAISLAPQALAAATKPGQKAPAPRSLAMQTQQGGGGDSLYQRAAMNQQARMQKRKGPRRFI